MDWLEIFIKAATIVVPFGGLFAWMVKRLDHKFDKIEKRFDKVDQKLERIETDLSRVSERVARLEGAMWRNGTGG